jgi:hypothetical protein
MLLPLPKPTPPPKKPAKFPRNNVSWIVTEPPDATCRPPPEDVADDAAFATNEEVIAEIRDLWL